MKETKINKIIQFSENPARELSDRFIHLHITYVMCIFVLIMTIAADIVVSDKAEAHYRIEIFKRDSINVINQINLEKFEQLRLEDENNWWRDKEQFRK